MPYLRLNIKKIKDVPESVPSSPPEKNPVSAPVYVFTYLCLIHGIIHLSVPRFPTRKIQILFSKQIEEKELVGTKWNCIMQYVHCFPCFFKWPFAILTSVIRIPIWFQEIPLLQKWFSNNNHPSRSQVKKMRISSSYFTASRYDKITCTSSQTGRARPDSC